MLRLIQFKVTIHDDEDIETLDSLLDFLKVRLSERL